MDCVQVQPDCSIEKEKSRLSTLQESWVHIKKLKKEKEFLICRLDQKYKMISEIVNATICTAYLTGVNRSFFFVIPDGMHEVDLMNTHCWMRSALIRFDLDIPIKYYSTCTYTRPNPFTIVRYANVMHPRNVVRRILKLQSCERASRVGKVRIHGRNRLFGALAEDSAPVKKSEEREGEGKKRKKKKKEGEKLWKGDMSQEGVPVGVVGREKEKEREREKKKYPITCEKVWFQGYSSPPFLPSSSLPLRFRKPFWLAMVAAAATAAAATYKYLLGVSYNTHFWPGGDGRYQVVMQGLGIKFWTSHTHTKVVPQKKKKKVIVKAAEGRNDQPFLISTAGHGKKRKKKKLPVHPFVFV